MKNDRLGQMTPRPRYLQLAEDLIGEIRDGRLSVGQTLPGEFELCESYGVSRHTVREALRRLEELGLITRQRGVGTVVTASDSRESYVQKVRSPAQLMQYPPESRLMVISSGEVVADRVTARLLGCTSRTRWYRIRAIRQLRPGGAAIAWSDIYVLPEYADIVAAVGRQSTPIYELLEQRFDERVATVQVDLFAGLITADRAELLGVAAGTPSLSVVRRYTGRNKRVFEVSVSEHPAGRYTYSLELHRGWSSGEGWAAG
ncbi:MAG: GntR family transcriptional regulator [Sinobacteraceae bacterium]|nr:GntR family transcriptional regulator [Nevskiaceae bacterium]MCP5359639.1 GntR family transcriptional regulator [Nevskiaceae bacterium]